MKVVKQIHIIFTIMIFSPFVVYGLTTPDDLAKIWKIIATESCVDPNNGRYSLADPTKCAPQCDFDAIPARKFCSLPTAQENEASPAHKCDYCAYGCADIRFTSCDVLLKTTTSAVATTVSTTVASTTSATSSSAATTTSATTPESVVTTTSGIPSTTQSAGSEPTPQMSDSAKKWVGSGDSTAVNSKIPVPQKAMRDYIDPGKCCEMAKNNGCDTNKWYMRVACANTCGSIGTDIYNAGGATSKLREDCK